MSLSPAAITEAIIAVMRGPDGAATPDPIRAASIAALMADPLARLFGSRPPGELAANPAFRRLLSEHLPTAQGDQAQQHAALLRMIQGANITSADYSAALTTASRIAASGETLARLAHAIIQSEGRGGASSLQRSLGLSSGYYTAHNLPPELRFHIDGPRATPAQVAQAANYAVSLGLDPSRYAGHFVGTSEVVRTALRDHIRSGAALTDQHVTSTADARAVIAAVQAGKIEAQNVPPSVQKIMEDMRAKGLDPATADAKAIEGYFQQNPQALQTAKAANASDIAATADQSPAQLAQKAAAAEQKAVSAAPQTQAVTASASPPRAPQPIVSRPDI